MLAAFREWWKWWIIGRAEAVVWRYGYAVYRREVVEGLDRCVTETLPKVAALERLATVGEHASPLLRRRIAELVSLLMQTRRDLTRPGFQHISDALIGALAGLLIGALARSGTRSL